MGLMSLGLKKPYIFSIHLLGYSCHGKKKKQNKNKTILLETFGEKGTVNSQTDK